jgi:hypothetical protein
MNNEKRDWFHNISNEVTLLIMFKQIIYSY